MSKIRISIISYINTIPFLYGINTLDKSSIIVEKDVPSVCAEKLINNKVDIGLVPVTIIPEINNYTILSDFCIGAMKSSKTVLLLSNVPLQEIKNIYLDNESKTSVILAKILAEKFWKINPIWYHQLLNVNCQLSTAAGIVVIGDKTFKLSERYSYQYDLTSEWFKYTGLPFVFACWVTNKELSENFITEFNNVIAFGVSHKTKALKKYLNNRISFSEAEDYINNYISYEFDEEKKKGMNLFFNFVKELSVYNLLAP